MSSQRLVVEAAFGFGPFDAITFAGDWIQLNRPDTGATRLMGASWSYGRDDEFEHFPAGTATLTLWNRDRRLDPDYSGAYVGLVPMVPVRVRSQNVDTLTYQDEFYGYVQGGWEQVLTEQGTLGCRLQLVDLLGVLSGHRLPDVFDYSILSQGSGPVGYWVLDREDAERVADLSGNGHDGTVGGTGGVHFGDRVIKAGHRPAADFEVDIDASSERNVYGHVNVTRSPLIPSTSTDFSVVVTFQARSKGTLNWRTLLIQADGNSPGKGFQLVVKTDGKLQWKFVMGGISSATDTTASIVDGLPHIAIGTQATFDVDGANYVGGSAVPLGGNNGFSIGGGPGIQDQDHMDGWIGVVALYDFDLTSLQKLALAIGYLKLDGATTDGQITWALDVIGVPAGARNLDVGTVFMGPADTDGRDALEWMREVTATEGGTLYVDHRNGGDIRFTNRYSRSLATRSVTAQAAFTDDPNNKVGIFYSPDGLDIAPNGLDGIVNQATVRWRDGEIAVSDETSIAAYGARERTIDTAGTTPGHARSVGEWVVAQNKDPRSRVRGCVAADRAFAARHDDVHDLQIGDKVTFRVHPLGVGDPSTVTLFVDGIDNVSDEDVWETRFRFAQDQTFTPWLWGTGLWGTTTLWG